MLLMPLYQEFTALKGDRFEAIKDKDEAVYRWSNHKYRMAMGYT